MSELFGPFKNIPKGAGVYETPAQSFLGAGKSSMIPIPNLSLTGGAAAPSSVYTSFGPVTLGGLQKGNNSWLSIAVVGIVVIVGLKIWARK